MGYVLLRISMVAVAVGGKTSGKPRLNMPISSGTIAENLVTHSGIVQTNKSLNVLGDKPGNEDPGWVW